MKIVKNFGFKLLNLTDSRKFKKLGSESLYFLKDISYATNDNYKKKINWKKINKFIRRFYENLKQNKFYLLIWNVIFIIN